MEDFEQENTRANINRAPYDTLSGVTYKRAANIKRVYVTPPALESGSSVTRWLFSEHGNTAEGLLDGARFAFLHDVTLAPGAATPLEASALDEVLYVIAGDGQMRHAPEPGSPLIARPLRPGDAALIRAGEQHSIINLNAADELRYLRLGLRHA